ncbi:hypothetical protein KX729_08805 [Rhizobium sp. XQZ8]|uniref:hypothetical protein n=1 Tax=Rhizobium populisoli TaxID=2859785 RepID=UPI001CA51ADD|nr:hypothetical protein [Rhizobium populisoli]MBW6421539.1 hypothetical protein [Rhizobium populisoli]
MPDILERQAALQAQADTIVEKLDLPRLLGLAGKPVRVGSSTLGLMVLRDIDITTICDRLDASTRRTIAEIASELMLDQRIGAVRYRNDTGAWNVEPHAYPDGLYLAVTYRSERDEDWNLDLWFVDQPARQPDIAHLKTLAPRLTDDIRRTILAIKAELAANTPKGSRPASSALVYEAVLDGSVSSIAGFEAWLTGRNKP